MPLYHLALMYARDGVVLARSTMCGWHEQLADQAQRPVDAMLRDAFTQPYLCTDATGVLVRRIRPGPGDLAAAHVPGRGLSCRAVWTQTFPHRVKVRIGHDYYQHETDDPPLGSLWRVDLATGDKHQIAPRVSPWMRLVSDQTYLIPFDNQPFLTTGGVPGTYKLEYLELASGKYTPLVDAASAVDPLPGEGVVYLDARGPDPGVWATPLPNGDG